MEKQELEKILESFYFESTRVAAQSSQLMNKEWFTLQEIQAGMNTLEFQLEYSSKSRDNLIKKYSKQIMGV